MTIEIPYQKWLDGIERPLIDIELMLPNNKLHRTKALVDSGADSCVFDIEIAQNLGVDLSNYRVSKAIAAGGNTFKSIDVPLFIKFQDKEIKVRASCCSFRDDKGQLIGMNLLGRDFFKYFKITFYEKRKIMIFEQI